jgi:hypothetical protein
MRIIALLFAFMLTGCEGNRLKAETKPAAVALRALPMAATFAATVFGGLADSSARARLARRQQPTQPLTS